MSVFLSSVTDFKEKFFPMYINNDPHRATTTASSSNGSGGSGHSYVPIKLVVTEIKSSDTHRAWRRLVSPLASIFLSHNVFPQFGIFHTSLIIGDQLFDWNSSSLCIPRECMSEKAVLVTTVTSIDTKQFQSMIDPIIEYIIHCNTNLEYVNYGGDHCKTLNCQDFVLRLLGVMNLDIQCIMKKNDDQDVQRYLRGLRKSGKCLAVAKRFETRSQLENFIHESALRDPQFITGSEYRLLRATAEAMELKYRKYKDRLTDSESILEKCDWEIKMLMNSRILNPEEQKELRKLQKIKSKAQLEINSAEIMCQWYGVV
jgi:hypothetical protein